MNFIFKNWHPPTAHVVHALTVTILAVTVLATGYDAPCRICHTRAKTITGKSVKHPGVASGRWRVGTVLHIQGIGRRTVDDKCRGPLDIRFTGRNAHKRAKLFGHRRLKVKVLRKPHKHAQANMLLG